MTRLGCAACLAAIGELHARPCALAGQVNSGPPKFVGVGPAVMQGAQRVAVACSKTMAKRIAHALNVYKPNREGV